MMWDRMKTKNDVCFNGSLLCFCNAFKPSRRRMRDTDLFLSTNFADLHVENQMEAINELIGYNS